MAANNTYLVLGANGFIGSHIVDALAAQGDIVRAYDRFRSSQPGFNEVPNIEVVKAEVSDEKALAQALEGVEYVIHCFSGTTPSSADNDPYSDVTENVLTSIKLFELAVQAKVKKIVFVSSGGAVYGSRAESGVVKEDDRPEPISPYGICKLAIEHYLSYYQRKFGLDHVIYRLTNPYGPRQQVKHNQGVVPAFLGNIMASKPITVFGDGSMSRDYIYIEDAVAMMQKGFSQPTKHTVYNIGSGIQTSLNEIIETLTTLVSSPPVVEYKPAPKTFLQKTPVSIERFEAEFGKITPTPLQVGLQKTLVSLT